MSESVIHNCIGSIPNDIKIVVVDNSNNKSFKNEIEKKYQFHKDKENSFENPIEEKANNDELKWLEFVLEQVKN